MSRENFMKASLALLATFGLAASMVVLLANKNENMLDEKIESDLLQKKREEKRLEDRLLQDQRLDQQREEKHQEQKRLERKKN